MQACIDKKQDWPSVFLPAAAVREKGGADTVVFLVSSEATFCAANRVPAADWRRQQKKLTGLPLSPLDA